MDNRLQSWIIMLGIAVAFGFLLVGHQKNWGNTTVPKEEASALDRVDVWAKIKVYYDDNSVDTIVSKTAMRNHHAKYAKIVLNEDMCIYWGSSGFRRSEAIACDVRRFEILEDWKT